MTLEYRAKLAHVQVATCDGTGCEADIDTEKLPYDDVWFTVERPYRGDDRVWDRREWHFCSVTCLEDWAKQQCGKAAEIAAVEGR